MQKSGFASCHPWVVLLYLIAVLIVTMSGMHPVMIVTSFCISLAYSFFVCGKTVWKRTLFVGVFVAVFAMGILPLFRHNGVTPLFYMNDMAVTFESIFFGGMMTLLLLAVLQWFFVWNELLGQEKLMYLIGRPFPAIALIVSMTMRLMPLLEKRLAEIRAANQGLGGGRLHGKHQRRRMGLRNLSVLVSWSLEDSLETSTLMETRGYGIQRRTSFHLYKWRFWDTVWIMGVLALLAVEIWLLMGGNASYAYFPELHFEMEFIRIGTSAGLFALMAGIPLAYDVCRYLHGMMRRRRVGGETVQEKEREYIRKTYC